MLRNRNSTLGAEETRQPEILSCSSEEMIVENVTVLYFQNFSFTIFRLQWNLQGMGTAVYTEINKQTW